MIIRGYLVVRAVKLLRHRLDELLLQLVHAGGLARLELGPGRAAVVADSEGGGSAKVMFFTFGNLLFNSD